MAWLTLADVSDPNDLNNLVPDVEGLRAGTRIRVRIRFSWPIAGIYDWWGINFLSLHGWQIALPDGVRADRVYAIDSYTVCMEGTVIGSEFGQPSVTMAAVPLAIVPALLKAIALFVAALAFLVISIKVEAEEIPGIARWTTIALVAGGVIIAIAAIRRNA
ncbi:MAG: hypothetical protein JW954_08080 [Dehalococcoidaceae bacterium]|nr:hypothetical protein [Dehalococcoidaceae bacterium]